MSDEPIIDLSSDDYFMGEALRQAMKAWDAEEVPIGAVIVHEGRILSRGFNQVEMLNDATAHAEMLALTAAEEAFGNSAHRNSRVPCIFRPALRFSRHLLRFVDQVTRIGLR